ncbi:MAG TPA: S1/P1 nuclease [Blastocatellia bacterium]
MRKLRASVACSLILLVATAVNSYGWNGLGHMAVAYAAYQQLTPRARNRVDALLRLNPQYQSWLAEIPAGTSQTDARMMAFMIAATWADQIKSIREYHNDGSAGGNRPPDDATAGQNIGYQDSARHKYWHFIDVPFSQDGTPLVEIPAPNAQTQIIKFRETLSSNAADDLKSYDLVWLLHLVGDVHQPLHCTTRCSKDLPNGDQGGNLVKLTPPPPNELHAFWDDLLGTGDGPIAAIAAGKRLPAPNRALVQNMDVAAWVKESFEYARTRVYVNPPIGPGTGPFTITLQYRAAAFALAQQRVSLAGARLARILNNELK